MADRYRDGVPVVDLRGAVALLGNFPALAGVDLTVEPGEIVLVRGPNGAGKTTLLRLCAGLVRPEAGSVEVLGHDLVHERRSVRRRVALLGHAMGLYDDLTVVQNVHFWARAAGLSAEEATDRVGVAMVRLGVAERLFGQPVHTLSAGQRRRASLAALVVRRPELWLLDEPHADLDQAGRDVVDVLIGDAVASGATVLVSSHELDRVAVLGPRVVTIAGGVVVDDTGRGDGGGSRG